LLYKLEQCFINAFPMKPKDSGDK